MDEKQAWENFARTGRVSDYLKYSQLKGRERSAGKLELPPPQGNELRSVFPVEVKNAADNPGADNQGAGGGGERPACYRAD